MESEWGILLLLLFLFLLFARDIQQAMLMPVPNAVPKTKESTDADSVVPTANSQFQPIESNNNKFAFDTLCVLFSLGLGVFKKENNKLTKFSMIFNTGMFVTIT